MCRVEVDKPKPAVSMYANTLTNSSEEGLSFSDTFSKGIGRGVLPMLSESPWLK